MNQNNIIKIFEDRLPKKPYYSDDLCFGLRINAVEKAKKAKLIQPNGPTHKYWFIFDVDRKGAFLDWEERGAPAPNLAIMNPNNKHAHLLYGLETPVRTAKDAKLKPLKYAAAIEHGLRLKLGSDMGYSGLICKNPLNSYWCTHTFTSELYTLDYLAEYVDIQTPVNDVEPQGLGRNVDLFDTLRKWAYRAIRQGWPKFDQWLTACSDRALMINTRFTSPLDNNEVDHVAKSVAKWTFNNFSERSFSDIQAARGAKGGAKSKGGGRKKDGSSDRQKKPWENMGISRATYYRNKKTETKTSHIR
ncbi:replicase [Oleiphilus sp. HI0061]|uniref:replication initiation protein n=1 Tax=Oleiphilus sp. HI0061 TaxID=1822239 RepID=UPI0007CFB080|nr:replication initiation protein [Oleiphilus sp. HI0061]KZY62512.1 replicase [Oleiphilus sp. HI0061]KZY62521.1 replicase [Oleiphilus sp. HI0061]